MVNKSAKYQILAILILFGPGLGSIYLFYQVTSLPFLQGIKEEEIQTAVSFAWVMIFPLWIVLFFEAMALLETFLRKLDSLN